MTDIYKVLVPSPSSPPYNNPYPVITTRGCLGTVCKEVQSSDSFEDWGSVLNSIEVKAFSKDVVIQAFSRVQKV